MLVRQRRYLGVATFAYAVPHLVAYLAKLADTQRIVSEAIEPGMLAGWIAMLVFTALAATSNNAAVHSLGRRWKTLHRWVYAGAILTFVHWILLAFDPLQGYVHAGVLVLVLALRFVRRDANGSARAKP